MKTTLKPLLYLTALNISSAFLLAAGPSQINYQGLLADSNGNPLSGNKTIAVKLFNVAIGGMPIYEETIGSAQVVNGIYNFQFGAAGNGIAAVLNGPENYLAVYVDNVEQSPRTKILAVPFAMRSADAQALTQQVDELESAFDEEIATINTQVTAIGGNLTSLRTQVQTLTGGEGALGLQGPAGPKGDTGATGAIGATGAQGPTGPKGDTGTTGPQGLSGRTILSGTNSPDSSLGSDGDFYINTANLTISGPKTSGTWGNATTLAGPQGDKGEPGNTGLLLTDLRKQIVALQNQLSATISMSNEIRAAGALNNPTFVLTGPSVDSAEQQIDLTTDGSVHKAYFYNNWDGNTRTYTGTSIVVDGVGVAAISYTTDRIGQIFGYSVDGNEPQFFGRLVDAGNVYFNTPESPLVNNPTFVLTGPSVGSAEQQIDLTTDGSVHKAYFYNNWDGNTRTYTSTTIVVDGVGVAAISHTEDRVGQIFGYSVNGNEPQFFGRLTNRGEIEFKTK